MMHLIKEIKGIENFELLLLFNTQEIRKVNLEPKFKEWSVSPNSKFAQLLNKTNFESVKIDPEMETLIWDNGIDLCPNVLYEMSEPITRVSSIS